MALNAVRDAVRPPPGAGPRTRRLAMRRLATALLAIAAVLAASVAAYAALGGADRGPAPRAAAGSSVAGSDQRPCRRPVSPGQQTTIHARARNRTSGPVRLRWVLTDVGRAGSGCASRWLRTERIEPRAWIAAGARLRLEIPVAMPPAAPDSCQNATFPLSYVTRVWIPEAGR